MRLISPTFVPAVDKPTAALAQSFPRRPIGGSGLTVTSGRLYLSLIELRAGQTITSLSFWSAATPGSGLTHGWAALFDSALAPIVQSTDDTTTATWSASAERVFTLSTPYLVPTTGWYYGGLCVAGTPPTVHGVTAPTGLFLAAPYVGGGSTTGLTGTAPNPAVAPASTTVPYFTVA